jgi:hypothetical protein
MILKKVFVKSIKLKIQEKTAFLKLLYSSEDSSKTNNSTKTLYTNMKTRGYELFNGMCSIFLPLLGAEQ